MVAAAAAGPAVVVVTQTKAAARLLVSATTTTTASILRFSFECLGGGSDRGVGGGGAIVAGKGPPSNNSITHRVCVCVRVGFVELKRNKKMIKATQPSVQSHTKDAVLSWQRKCVVVLAQENVRPATDFRMVILTCHKHGFGSLLHQSMSRWCVAIHIVRQRGCLGPTFEPPTRRHHCTAL